MVYYLQRENNTTSSVSPGGIVPFETSITISGPDTLPPSYDFAYQPDGSIDIFRAGIYMIHYYVAGMTGLSTIGQSLEISKKNYAQNNIWVPVAKTTNHIKNGQTTGFAVIRVTQEEINDFSRATIALINAASQEEVLTFLVPKAGILIFGLNFEDLERKLVDIDTEIQAIFQKIDALENFVHLSDVVELLSLFPPLSGLGVSVITSGYTHNFWGTGTLNHQQTLVAGEVYYIITADQYPPLTNYQGESTISTLWIETPGPDPLVYSLPIRFDDTGIYFRPDTTYPNLPVGTIFRFTQALILVEVV